MADATTLRFRSTLQALRERVRRTQAKLSRATARAPSDRASTGPSIRPASPRGEDLETPFVERRVRFDKRTLGLFVRPYSLDGRAADLIFRREGLMRLPGHLTPRIIFDVGAGIGLSTIYFALRYPQATVYAFEPHPGYLALLKRNVERHCLNVQVLGRGLADHTGRLTLVRPADAFHGGRLVRTIPSGEAEEAIFTAPVTSVGDALRVLQLDGVDVLHLNAPGTELAVLHGIPDNVRSSVQAYLGTLHGADDWDVCAGLSRTHSIAMNRSLEHAHTPFLAVRKDLTVRSLS